MKLTKNTTISFGLLLAIGLPFWALFSSKADKADVEKVEEKIEKKSELDLEQSKLISGAVEGLKVQTTLTNMMLDKMLKAE